MVRVRCAAYDQLLAYAACEGRLPQEASRTPHTPWSSGEPHNQQTDRSFSAMDMVLPAADPHSLRSSVQQILREAASPRFLLPCSGAIPAVTMDLLLPFSSGRQRAVCTASVCAARTPNWELYLPKSCAGTTLSQQRRRHHYTTQKNRKTVRLARPQSGSELRGMARIQALCCLRVRHRQQAARTASERFKPRQEERKSGSIC